jgi:sugar transferase (PEP-CTERM system associated)
MIIAFFVCISMICILFLIFFETTYLRLEDIFSALSIALLGTFFFTIAIDYSIDKFNLQKKVLLVGASKEAQKLCDLLRTPDNKNKYNVIGFIDNNIELLDRPFSNIRVIGTMSDLSDIATKSKVDFIVISPIKRGEKNFDPDVLLKLKFKGLNLLELPSFYEMVTGKIVVENLRPSWLIFSEGFNISWRTRIFKKTFSMIMALLLFIVTLPVMLIAAMLIKIDSKGPIFYRQERVGKNGKTYTLFKFRTMVHDAEKLSGPKWAADKDPRITKLGNILRKFRIDELPQVFNVLMGDMNFVGPRPERPFFVEQLRHQIPYYNLRLTIEPGITGWAAIKSGYGATLEDSILKLEYDLYYIKNMSLTFDIIILFMTLRVILFGDGAR